MTNIERWLTPEQWEAYIHVVDFLVDMDENDTVFKAVCESAKDALKSTARYRMLLKKHEWIKEEDGYEYCPECEAPKTEGHYLHCAAAIAFEGLPEPDKEDKLIEELRAIEPPDPNDKGLPDVTDD